MDTENTSVQILQQKHLGIQNFIQIKKKTCSHNYFCHRRKTFSAFQHPALPNESSVRFCCAYTIKLVSHLLTKELSDTTVECKDWNRITHRDSQIITCAVQAYTNSKVCSFYWWKFFTQDSSHTHCNKNDIFSPKITKMNG